LNHPAAPESPSVLQRAALVAFGVLVAVVAVELSLQAVAFVTYLGASARYHRADAVGTRTLRVRTALCLGDSYTYGEGASGEKGSYPSQLEQLLNARENGPAGVRWRVVNRGWPGRNSAEVLQRTPGYLTTERPDYVVVLVGANDRWSHREMDLPPPQLDDVPSHDSATWTWELRTLRLIELFSIWGEETSSIDGADDKLKDADAAALRARVEALRGPARNSSDAVAAEQLVEALAQLRMHAEVASEGLAAIQRYGPTPRLCALLVAPLARIDRLDEAVHWADIGLTLSPNNHDAVVLYHGRAYARLRKHDFTAALSDMARAFIIHGDEERLGRYLRKLTARKPEALDDYRSTFDRLGVDESIVRRAEKVISRVREEAADTQSFRVRLGDDVNRIVTLIRRAGAVPLVLTYPVAQKGVGDVSDTLRETAHGAKALLVDLAPVFAPLASGATRDTYFTSDSHCTDAGYRIVAERVANALGSLEAKRHATATRPS